MNLQEKLALSWQQQQQQPEVQSEDESSHELDDDDAANFIAYVGVYGYCFWW